MKVDINKVKIIVTVPEENVDSLREALCSSGAGVIGNYTFCSMTSKVIGTFMPNEKANPYIGSKNTLEFVKEEKLEVICEVQDVKKVLKALRQAHPYEEPGIDIIPLLDEKDFE